MGFRVGGWVRVQVRAWVQGLGRVVRFRLGFRMGMGLRVKVRFSLGLRVGMEFRVEVRSSVEFMLRVAFRVGGWVKGGV